jgi:hypothetical protein
VPPLSVHLTLQDPENQKDPFEIGELLHYDIIRPNVFGFGRITTLHLERLAEKYFLLVLQLLN